MPGHSRNPDPRHPRLKSSSIQLLVLLLLVGGSGIETLVAQSFTTTATAVLRRVREPDS
jgi:hypothetical protein